MRRWGVFLLALLVLLCAGCSTQAEKDSSDVSGGSAVSQTGEASSVLQSFSLAYSRDDTLNPYVAQTEANSQLATLLYDSLTVLDDTFRPANSLAGSLQQQDATHWVATVRQGALFSDGSAVSPADVTASFYAARSGSLYRALLSNVTAATVNRRTNEIVFTLATPDPNTAACLSFPIIKAGTATTAKESAPVGGGLYVFCNDGDGARLTANPHFGKKPRYETIYLRHLPNAKTMYYGLSSGNITYYYDDLADGQVPRVSGASVAVNMNALVFLGVNENKTALNQPAVRRALSLALDRQTLMTAACSGWAIASASPVHPKWGVLTTEQTSPQRNLSEATTLLASAGYGLEHQKLTLELIYSSENGNRATLAEAVRSQLEGLGVTVKVVPLSYANYQTRVKNGQYDLYIGDIRLTAAMDLNPLLKAGTAVGISATDKTSQTYADYRQGIQSLDAFLTVFSEEMPYIPLGWRCGFAAYDRRLTQVTPHGYNVYYGIDRWN